MVAAAGAHRAGVQAGLAPGHGDRLRRRGAEVAGDDLLDRAGRRSRRGGGRRRCRCGRRRLGSVGGRAPTWSGGGVGVRRRRMSVRRRPTGMVPASSRWPRRPKSASAPVPGGARGPRARGRVPGRRRRGGVWCAWGDSFPPGARQAAGPGVGEAATRGRSAGRGVRAECSSLVAVPITVLSPGGVPWRLDASDRRGGLVWCDEGSSVRKRNATFGLVISVTNGRVRLHYRMIELAWGMVGRRRHRAAKPAQGGR